MNKMIVDVVSAVLESVQEDVWVFVIPFIFLQNVR